MLTPEQATEVLRQHRAKDEIKRQLQVIADLPEALRPLAYGLLRRDAAGNLVHPPTRIGERDQTLALRQRTLALLDALPAEERVRIFSVFFPTLAGAVESAWDFMRGLPYALGPVGAGNFRAPRRPEVTLDARGAWLLQLENLVGVYHEDIVWLARHAAYLQVYATPPLGLLFAAVIDADPARGDEVLRVLMASARGEDEIGMYGRHIPIALLAAACPEGWECVERLLLGAQREEGVRQTILDAASSAHRQAFRHILGTILDNNLVRFSAVTRAVNQWLDASWDSDQAATVTRVLRQIHALLDDPDMRADALTYGNGEDVYLALWAAAREDVYAALPLAERALGDSDVARRYAATRLLAAAGIPEAVPPLLRALKDPDARVVAQASAGLSSGWYLGMERGELLHRGAPDAFDRIEAVLPRLPRPSATPQPLLWDLQIPALDRASVADLLVGCLDERDPKRLIPQLGTFSAYGRVRAAQRLATNGGLWDPQARAALLPLLKDRASYVSEEVLNILRETPVAESEVPALEDMLRRKSERLRRGVLSLLTKLADETVLASAARLAVASNNQQRLAGLEALRMLHDAGRARAACASAAAAYRERRRALSASEEALLAPLLGAEHEVPTLENALGLVRVEELTPPVAPEPRGRAWTSPAAVAGLLALDQLIHEHRADAYTAVTHIGTEEVLLGSDGPWRFPYINASVPIAEDVARLPFADVWRGWAEARDGAMRDGDGLEVLRMLIQIDRRGAEETRAILARMFMRTDQREAEETETNPADAGAPDVPRLSLRYPILLEKLCWWLIRLYPGTGAADFLLDHLETVLTQIPERELREPEDPVQFPRYREYQKLQRAVALTRAHRTQCPAEWTDACDARLWRQLRWTVSLPQPHLRYRPSIEEALAAHRAGAASEADLVYQFLGPRTETLYSSRAGFDELHTCSPRKPPALLAEYPVAGEIYAHCLSRVLDVELRRGAQPTAATEAALSLRSIAGTAAFVRVLQALDGEQFTRGYADTATGRSHTLSHLLRATFPAADEPPEVLADLARGAGIPEGRLVEAAVYAPQWSGQVERVLGWDGFAEAVWWVHAHTKDRNWQLDQAIRDEWEAQIGERTPLASDDLYDGAVDVAWFRRAIGALGEERWESVYQAAKYSSGGTGHARARLFADAMLGRVEPAALIQRITTKRNRDAVAALGLVGLPELPGPREDAILARYQLIQEFQRTSQAFGAQRREGDQKAARIGLENLARTAGYADPARFQWAMERREVADLAAGPLVVTRGGLAVILQVDPLGQPRLRVEKAGKALKEIPARIKKEPEVVALRERKQRLERQSARMRAALERAMSQRAMFPAGELAGLLRHPLLAPMLEQLVFVGPGGMGYLVAEGTALRSLDGDTPLPPETPLRIAHPHDLYASGEWSRWQRECFAAERIQPFKQVFRELYPLTEAERRDGAFSRRYAGQQIQPQRAMALLGGCGWVTSVQDGSVERTFHGSGVTASVEFLFGGGTSAEVEGLTIEGVVFHAAGDVWGKPLPLEEVPPVLFSEAMRDLDLVVSVAHRGGIDPEGSASTVEMRVALLREVCAALSLANVRIQSAHALVAGTLGEYSVHLGSGVVHRLPGGAVCIVPVYAQHRGRIFLPFADDDPKSAEVVSKVLLLARDAEIKDPLILEQLSARM